MQIFNGLFWMQQEPVWSAILLVWIAGYLPVLSFRPSILMVEEIVFWMGIMAALLRLFRRAGLAGMKHMLSLSGPLLLWLHLSIYYAGLHY